MYIMKKLSEYYKEHLTEESQQKSFHLGPLLEKYQGPIANYPVQVWLPWCYESLVCTFPAEKFINKLQSLVDFKLEYTLNKISHYLPGKVFDPEDYNVILTVTHEQYMLLDREDLLVNTANFYGYYINSIFKRGSKIIINIYPKFQAKFLLKNEQYLIHITPTNLVSKILTQGFKPYSKVTKLDNIKKFKHNYKELSKYHKLSAEWEVYNHEDMVHFTVGSSVPKNFCVEWLLSFCNIDLPEISVIVLDVSKISSKVSFCVDPNCSTEYLSSVYTTDNVSPDTIVKVFNFNCNDKEQVTKEFSNLLNFVK